MASFIRITHNNSEIETVGDFFTQPINLVTGIEIKDWLDYTGDSDRSNFDRIKRQHTLEEDKAEQQGFYDDEDYSSIKLIVGTPLLIPVNNVVREALYAFDDNVISTVSSKAFLADELELLLRDPNYTVAYGNNESRTKEHNAGISVYMWSRSLSPDDDTSPQGAWVDISPFVMSVSTQVGKEGGSFTLNMAPVIGTKSGNKGWKIDPDSLKHYAESKKNKNVIAFAPTRKRSGNKNSEIRESNFFFNEAVQENDIVYVRFERLKAENPNEDGSLRIGGNIYDMIGLVDRTTLTAGYETSDLTVTIDGRDLMKLLIEDGSYFFPLQFAQNVFAQNGSRLISERSKIDGSILTLTAYLERSILTSLQFIFSQLSTTGFVPDNVFTQGGYVADSLSKTFIIPGAADALLKKQQRLGKVASNEGKINSSENEVKDVNQPGVWQVIRLLVDPSVAERRIVDSSIAQEQGSMINSVYKLCQDPFVEFFGDTYGDKYVFQARKPPFDSVSAVGMIYDDVVTTDANDTNSSPQDKKKGRLSSIIDRIKQGSITGSLSATQDRLSDLTLDIEDVDVISKVLYYDNEAYSWYHIRPSGLLWGNATELTMAYVPAVSFDEYASVFGSRVYSKENNYIPYRAIEDSNKEQKDSYLLRQVVEDLKYMIDSTQYLPFTRKGTIVLNGDRTYKRGTFVRLKSTNEVFYIDEVENTWGINMNEVERTTTLTVSKGMVEPYIRGVEKTFGSDRVNVSYFNIINTEIPEGAVTDSEFLKNWTVNENVFSFFLKRNQWK